MTLTFTNHSCSVPYRSKMRSNHNLLAMRASNRHLLTPHVCVQTLAPALTGACQLEHTHTHTRARARARAQAHTTIHNHTQPDVTPKQEESDGKYWPAWRLVCMLIS